MKKTILFSLLLCLLFTNNSFSEGYHCYYQISNESFKSDNEELREYHHNFLILRKDNQFYEVNDWLNTYDFRVLGNLDIVFENEDLLHLYGRDSDDKTDRRTLTMYNFNLDKVDGYFTNSITTTYGLWGGNDGRCEIISDDEVWLYE